MPFKKGQSGNEAGKPKGVISKTTKETKELLLSIVQHEIDHIGESLKLIRKNDPARYVEVLAKLLPYVVSRQIDIGIDTTKVITVIPPHKRQLLENRSQ